MILRRHTEGLSLRLRYHAIQYTHARRLPPALRLQSNLPPAPVATDPPPPINATEERKRVPASLFISNVFPIQLGRLDPRPYWAMLVEERLMERLHDIAADITGNGFRVESWEIARKDGGVFLHFSYLPPPPSKSDEVSRVEAESSILNVNSLPEIGTKGASNPARLFIPQFTAAASAKGGMPSWLGDWHYARRVEFALSEGMVQYSQGVQGTTLRSVGAGTAGEGQGTAVMSTGSGLRGTQEATGNGRVWLVKGRQWTEVRRSCERGVAHDVDRVTGYESIPVESPTDRVRRGRRIARNAVLLIQSTSTSHAFFYCRAAWEASVLSWVW